MTERVCHITTLHSVNDNRIFYKECISLKNNGYNVYLICAGTKSKVTQGINIIGLPRYKNRVIHFFRVSFFLVFRKTSVLVLLGVMMNKDKLKPYQDESKLQLKQNPLDEKSKNG